MNHKAKTPTLAALLLFATANCALAGRTTHPCPPGAELLLADDAAQLAASCHCLPPLRPVRVLTRAGTRDACAWPDEEQYRPHMTPFTDCGDLEL
jgi:hypothetical protein